MNTAKFYKIYVISALIENIKVLRILAKITYLKKIHL